MCSRKQFLAALNEIWPRATAEVELNPTDIFSQYDDTISQLTASTRPTDDEALLNFTTKLFDNDAARRTSIDTRAGALMPAITIAVTLVSGVGFSALKDVPKFSSAAAWCIFITYIIALAYLSRTVIRTFQILGLVERNTPGPLDVVPSSEPNLDTTRLDVGYRVLEASAYKREYAIKLLSYTVRNYRANNRQMDSLAIAQRCFRNALIVIVIGGCIAASIYMFASGPVLLNSIDD